MAGKQARPGRGVGDKGEQGNSPSLVQPSGSSAGWPSPISRQLTRPPAHSQPLQLDPTPLRADWPEEAQALARRQPGRYGATPQPRLPHGSRLSQQLRMEDSALGWAEESQPQLWIFQNHFSLCFAALVPGAGQNSEQMHLVNVGLNYEGFTKLLHSPDTLEVCQS